MTALPRIWQQQQLIGFFVKGPLCWAFLWFYRPSSLYRLRFICVKWLLGFYCCCCCSGFWNLLETIYPETGTNGNFHPMYFNSKMLVGRSQAKYCMDFIFFPESSILLFSTGKWEYLPLLSVTDNVKKALLAERKLQALKSTTGLRSYLEHFFYEWKSCYFFKLFSLIVCCFCGFLTEGNMEEATQNLNFSVWKQS